MDNKIGDKIKQKRKQMGLTLKELAGDRVTASQISAVENGKCKPSHGLLIYIAQRLSTDVEYFTESNEERCSKHFEKCKRESLEFFENKNYSDTINCIDNAKDTVGFLNDNQKGSYYYIKGNSYYEELLYKEAFENYIKALTYYAKTKDMETILDIYIKTGNCLYNTDQYDMALSYYIGASKYIDDKISCKTTARILFNISICYSKLKRYQLAKDSISRCSDYINANEFQGNEEFAIGLNMTKGIVDMESNQNELGIENFNQAFEGYKEKNDIIGMGRAINNAGTWFAENKHYEKAVECFNESIKYKIDAADGSLSDSYINLSDTYKEMGDFDKAMQIISNAEEIMLQKNNSKGLTEIMMAKLELLIQNDDYDKAEIHAFIVLDCIQKFSDIKVESKLYLMMSEMYRKFGDDKSSIQYLLKANQLKA